MPAKESVPMTIAAESYASPTRSSPHVGHPPRAGLGTQFHQVFQTFKHLTSLQLAIWMKQVKTMLTRIVLFAILSFIAFIFVVMAVIFLYAGVFHILTDVLHIPTVWALLIFAGVHLLTAGVLVLVAISMLHKRKDPDKSEKHS